MKIVTPSQMSQIDRRTIEEFGIPGIVLMENAAIKVFEKIKRVMKKLDDKRIIVIGGKGNNGGDAFAVARHLFNNNAKVKVYMTAPITEIKGDSKINIESIKNMNVEIRENFDMDEFIKDVQKSHAIVDGLFGTGLKGEIKGNYHKIIDTINSSESTIFSVDIPSGINGNSGEVMGIAVKADYTITFCLPKAGLIKGKGYDYCGCLEVADISIPDIAVERENVKLEYIDYKMVKEFLPKRYRESNKGTYGKVFIISGAKGMTGAGVLAANAAYVSGTGLVYLCVPDSLSKIYSINSPESVIIPLRDRGKGTFISLEEGEIKKFNNNIKKMDAICIGPGIGTGKGARNVVENVIDTLKPLVLDADALNILSKNIDILKNIKKDVVITPHPGEMARLLGVSVEELQSNREKLAREFSKKWNVYVVLKGNNTIVAEPDGSLYINSTGNNGMATAGSGDVLAGIITGLIGQIKVVKKSIILGVFLHGLAGDIAKDNLNEYSIRARDIINNIPKAINKIVSVETF